MDRQIESDKVIDDTELNERNKTIEVKMTSTEGFWYLNVTSWMIPIIAALIINSSAISYDELEQMSG